MTSFALNSMIKRVVKITLMSGHEDSFNALYEAAKPKILEFRGIHELQLYQAKDDEHTFFTISVWDNQDSLDHYRSSDFFKATWNEMKTHFNKSAEAWSLTEFSKHNKDV